MTPLPVILRERRNTTNSALPTSTSPTSSTLTLSSTTMTSVSRTSSRIVTSQEGLWVLLGLRPRQEHQEESVRSTSLTRRTFTGGRFKPREASTLVSSHSSTTTVVFLPKYLNSLSHTKSAITLGPHTTTLKIVDQVVLKGTSSCTHLQPQERDQTTTNSHPVPSGTSALCWELCSTERGRKTAFKKTMVPSVETRLSKTAKNVIVVTTKRNARRTVVTQEKSNPTSNMIPLQSHAPEGREPFVLRVRVPVVVRGVGTKPTTSCADTSPSVLSNPTAMGIVPFVLQLLPKQTKQNATEELKSVGQEPVLGPSVKSTRWKSVS